MAYQCDACRRGLRIERTDDPFEDLGVCPGCGKRITISWSRVFGERFEEVTRETLRKQEESVKSDEKRDDEPRMKINLESTSIVDGRSGEVATPSEAIERFRELELAITRADEDIEKIQGELKEAKTDRDEAIGALRAACREAKALPLFDGAGKAE